MNRMRFLKTLLLLTMVFTLFIARGPQAVSRSLAQPAVFDQFFQVSEPGFGDRQNSWAWSMRWWKGTLYVSTVRSFLCAYVATLDMELGTGIYPPDDPDLECAATPQELDLRAEIWRYTPQTRTWERVYQSPADVPIPEHPGKFVARDIGFRDMAIFVEPDGTEALYVTGVSSRSFNIGVPPPRILRSVDGVNFEAIPQDPGTFLGDLPVVVEDVSANRSFRSITVYKGRLYVTASDFRGVGALLESANPAAGNDTFRQVTPPDMKVWQAAVFNGYLYLGLESNDGYQVVKTDATGDPPYEFIPVVTKGGFKSGNKSENVLSMFVFNGRLYVGTDRPTELIRINPDDTWDLVVGAPRETPEGFKAPISGLPTGFGNIFNGHFWRMEEHAGRLYLGTWDWSVELRTIPFLDPIIKNEYGFDLFATPNGAHWYMLTRDGFGDDFNYGARSMASTPFGLFVGTANPFYGLQVWQVIPMPMYTVFLPLVDVSGTSTGSLREGRTEVQAPASLQHILDVPKQLEVETTGGPVILSWERPRGAVRFRIYRSALRHVRGPEELNATVPPQAGEMAHILSAGDEWVPEPFVEVGTTRAPIFVDWTARPEKRYLYFVRAEDAHGALSAPSNLVSAPSLAPPVTFAYLHNTITELTRRGKFTSPDEATALLAELAQARAWLAAGEPREALRTLRALHARVAASGPARVAAPYHEDLALTLSRLLRRVMLVQLNLLPTSAVD